MIFGVDFGNMDAAWTYDFSYAVPLVWMPYDGLLFVVVVSTLLNCSMYQVCNMD